MAMQLKGWRAFFTCVSLKLESPIRWFSWKLGQRRISPQRSFCNPFHFSFIYGVRCIGQLKGEKQNHCTCPNSSHLACHFATHLGRDASRSKFKCSEFLSGFSQFSHTFNLWQKWVMTSFKKKKKKKPWQAYSTHRRISFPWRWGFPLCRRVSVWWGFNGKRSRWNWMQTGIVTRWLGFDTDPTPSNMPTSILLSLRRAWIPKSTVLPGYIVHVQLR